MSTIKQIVLQEENEKRYSRKHIDGYIRDELAASPEIQAKLTQGVSLLEDFLAKSYYASKNIRLSQIKGMDLTELVTDMFVGIAYLQREELFTSVSAQMASRLRFSDKVDAIKTVAEMLAVVCATDAYDILKPDRMASLAVVSRIPLSEKLIGFILNSAYLPPMVCEPLELTSNSCSGYLSHNDSLILGSGNHHGGDICLDVLNIMNRTALQLDTEFLCHVEEEPKTPNDTADQVAQWDRFKRQSYSFYALIADQGNEFHMTHKVDCRGRLYSQGYHINPQGAAFKKAIIEFAHEELIEGVPAWTA
jgi:hypothetical protein